MSPIHAINIATNDLIQFFNTVVRQRHDFSRIDRGRQAYGDQDQRAVRQSAR